MQVEQRLLSVNFTKAKNKKLGICIHTMVGTLDGTDRYFNNPTSKVSSHYGVSLDGNKIYQWVPEDYIAWTQGIVNNPTSALVKELGGNPNTYIISIECADGTNPYNADRSKQTLEIARLVANIAKRNGIPLDRKHIIGHKEIMSTKGCPGNIDVDKVLQLAKEINNEKTVVLDADLPTWFEDEFQLKLFDWYSKYWTLREFITHSITASFDLQKTSKQLATAQENLASAEETIKAFNENFEGLEAHNKILITDIEGLRMKNKELVGQVDRILNKKYMLDEILTMFINWFKTGGDSIE